jgi:hypothetical protein
MLLWQEAEAGKKMSRAGAGRKRRLRGFEISGAPYRDREEMRAFAGIQHRRKRI